MGIESQNGAGWGEITGRVRTGALGDWNGKGMGGLETRGSWRGRIDVRVRHWGNGYQGWGPGSLRGRVF